MRRVVAALRWDLLLQARNGFVAVSVLLVPLWVGLLRQLPPGALDPSRFVPAAVVMNFLITTFYFVGGLLLLERSEGVLGALLVTPLRPAERLLAKLLSLTGLALLETMLIVAVSVGLPRQPLPLLVGAAGVGALYTLLGVVAVARYEGITDYLIPSAAWVVGLLLPLVDWVGLWRSPLFWLHPLQPALVLMRAAYQPTDGLRLLGCLGALALWLLIAFRAAQRALRRMAQAA